MDQREETLKAWPRNSKTTAAAAAQANAHVSARHNPPTNEAMTQHQLNYISVVD
jgi:hypothetical protein